MHSLTWLGYLAVAGAGLLAGMINAIIGSGSLITFPTLVALGLSPLVANVSNNIGIFVGAASGAVGYRRELVGQRSRIVRLGPWSIAGGILGAVLLLLKPGAFHEVVPALVLVGVVMVIIQPTLSRRLSERHGTEIRDGGVLLRVEIFLTGVYGGYFGAAQGVILIAFLVIAIGDGWVRMNALKTVLATLVNGVAAIVFLIAAPIEWSVVGVIALSSAVGAQIGAHVGRRLPDPVLRAIIVVGGIGVTVKLLA